MNIQEKIKNLEYRILVLEKDSYITITTEKVKLFFKRFLKICGWVGLLVITLWVIYIFLYGLNVRYGLFNGIIYTYHILYG